jgi:hypothetical protein
LYPQDRKYCINTIQMNIYMFDCIILSQCIWNLIWWGVAFKWVFISEGIL